MFTSCRVTPGEQMTAFDWANGTRLRKPGRIWTVSSRQNNCHQDIRRVVTECNKYILEQEEESSFRRYENSCRFNFISFPLEWNIIFQNVFHFVYTNSCATCCISVFLQYSCKANTSLVFNCDAVDRNYQLPMLQSIKKWWRNEIAHSRRGLTWNIYTENMY